MNKRATLANLIAAAAITQARNAARAPTEFKLNRNILKHGIQRLDMEQDQITWFGDHFVNVRRDGTRSVWQSVPG